MARASYIEAIRQAQMEEMQRDDRVFIMGEDIVCNVFGTTTGFTEMFGKERVRDTPISENGFIGASAGAAMVRMRPIVDVRISSFLHPTMDQIMSIIAKSRAVRKMLKGKGSLMLRNPRTAYPLSKKAVQLYALAMAPAFGAAGARIVSLSPGIIGTEWDGSKTRRGRKCKR